MVGQGAPVSEPESFHAEELEKNSSNADPSTMNFFTDDEDEADLDVPSKGFSSISDAIEDIRLGKVCIEIFSR